MLRDRLSNALKGAMKAKDSRRVSALRLIVATLQDRDIAARGKGDSEGISNDEILQMLQTMIRQRRESIAAYEQGGRLELAQQEQEEIGVIEEFLPPQLGPEEMRRAIEQEIAELGAGGLKDMGRTMAALKAKYAGRMDFGKASGIEAELRPLPEERLKWAQRVMSDYRNGNRDEPGTLAFPTAHMTLLFQERFGDKTTETIDLHAGRVGDLAFVTVPCEIFCHFGLQLKRRSPFPITAVFGVTNGEMGYCPTIEGAMGGSWEGTGSLISRWDIQTGYRIVDEWSRMLHGLA